jgi:hypothetical protein
MIVNELIVRGQSQVIGPITLTWDPGSDEWVFHLPAINDGGRAGTVTDCFLVAMKMTDAVHALLINILSGHQEVKEDVTLHTRETAWDKADVDHIVEEYLTNGPTTKHHDQGSREGDDKPE